MPTENGDSSKYCAACSSNERTTAACPQMDYTQLLHSTGSQVLSPPCETPKNTL